MVYCASASLYSDELISATELNRQPGRVLDRALEHPVTITRNDHSFALMRREEMANLVKASALTKIVVEIINIAHLLRTKQIVGTENPYCWLSVFDAEELDELVAELVVVFRQCSNTAEWEMLDAVIHEWHESAIAICSSDLKRAFSSELDEVPLTQPDALDVAA